MFSILPATVAFYFLIVGIFTLKSNKASLLAKIFFALCFMTFVWQFSWSILFQTSDYDSAYFIIKFGWICILFLPTTLYYFLTILSENNKEIKWVYYSYGFSAILLAFLLFSNYFISGAYSYFWGFYPKANFLHPLHVLQTTIVVLRGLYLTYKKQQNVSNYKIKSQLRYCVAGLLIYLFAAVDYLCNYGLELYPPGIIFITISLTIISYTMIKHKLLDLNIAASIALTRLLVYSFFLIIFSSIFFLITKDSLSDNKIYFISGTILILCVCETYDFIKRNAGRFSDEIFLKQKKYKDIEGKLNLSLENSLSVNNLLDIVKKFVETELESTLINFFVKDGLYIRDRDSNQKINSNGYIDINNKNKTPIIIDNNFIKKVIYSRTILEKDELDIKLPNKNNDDQTFIPFVTSDNLVGFITISTNKTFKFWHLEILSSLIGRIGVILDRIRVYQEFFFQQEKFLQERIDLTKSLAGSIAHEMRNPLGAIRLAISNSKLFFEGAIKAVDKNEAITLDKQDLESIVENYQVSLNSIKRANEIINITLNEIRGEKPDPAKFSYYNICDVLDQAVNEYGYKDKNERSKVINQLQTESSDCFIFKGDGTLFVYIIFNLLKNALYYFQSHPNSIITIGRQIDKEYNAIYINDTGPGIKPEILKNLFGDFVTSGKDGGTGLGLSFCKRTMQAFGGDITCESEFGKYTKFIIYFPKLSAEELKEAHKLMSDRQKGKDVDSPKKRILMVDDQKVNLMISKKLIENNLENTVLDTVESGSEAIEVLKKDNNYNLILMDIQMPELDGYQTTKEIRKFNKKIPIVAYSSRRSIEAKKDAAACGMSGYLAKPVDNNFLLRSVAKWALIFNYGKRSDEEITSTIQNKNILLVDDEITNRKITGKLLTKYKVNVTEATNGQEGFDILTKDYDKFDLIITDINMPIMDGISLIKKIRQFELENYNENEKRITAIAMTGDRNENLIYNILTSGFDDYLIKGGDPQEIFNAAALLVKIKNDEGYILSNLNIEQLAMIEQRIVNKNKITQTRPNITDTPIANDEKLSHFSIIEQKELIESFLDSTSLIIKEIKLAKIKNDPTKFFFESHALKGISGNIGSERLFKYTAYINEFGRNKTFPNDAMWFENLLGIFKETHEIYKNKANKM